MNKKLYAQFFKRIFDLIISLLVVIVALPFFVFLIPVISISNRGPVFFFQERPGKQGRTFKIMKLKTMNDKRDKSGNLLPDYKRITPLGNFLRSISIDELPQILNVLKGDMSLVGPRPLLKEYLPIYNARQSRRHEVLPGITGWAQVNGRNSISWEDKIEMDVWYVEHIKFSLDLKILFLTLLKVIKRHGINSSKNLTMKKFTGTSN